MRPLKRVSSTVRRFVLLLSLSSSTAVFAQPEVGAGVHYGNSLTVNAHVENFQFVVAVPAYVVRILGLLIQARVGGLGGWGGRLNRSGFFLAA